MHIDEFCHYISEIYEFEIIERNDELQKLSLDIKQEMNQRGLLNSTIFLEKFARLYAEEFKFRCKFALESIINSLSKLSLQECIAASERIKLLYQTLSINQRNKLIGLYNDNTSQVINNLQGNIPEQIGTKLNQKYDNYLHKNNKIIEFECKAIFSREADEKIIMVQPNFMGFGLDLRAFWNRING